ncbi:MAG: DNA translocase FtsK [Clostridiales bacterium]|nr:DNA translocase FtsK [Clostridiales bacterium]
MHTPQFAPLVGMEQFMPLVDDDDEEDPELLIAEEEPEPPKPYVFPPVDLLNLEQYRVPDTHEADQERAQKLVETLSSFGIPAKVQHVTHGPAITRFAMGLTASGINVKRIQNIADNIALDLAADGAIRIESQIPGTNLFGIEVPNKEIQTVTFAQVLLSPEMQSATSPLAVGLGHDITGKPIICDLCKMPHLLIAGQTGSGKSVCVNTIINSLLFRASPEDVRMIMIDPKVVELQSYNVVPHLLIPVVTDPHKAAGALAWAVAEMEDRYKKMLTKNVRELSAYNAKLEPGEPKLPRIVIIIDELADLMMASKHDVEESIIRLAQKARAAGIHMVVATQRPTVDVITGLIKSNVPSRIAFAVSSTVDSRTILDKVGAEKLLGRGDMLYMPTGCKAPVRVQGCFLSDAEIERIVSYIEENSKVEFDPDVMEALEKQEDDGSDALDDGGSDDGVDDRLQEAIEMVVTDGQASISMLQRRMKVGYARAGRLIDDMAARGIVSKSLGSKPREVLITREEYDRIKDALFDE